MADKQWHLYENGQQLPERFSTEDIQERMQANPGVKYLVWRQGMDGWKPPKDLPEFQKAAAPTPTPAPEAAAPPTAPASNEDQSGKEAVDKMKAGGRKLAKGTAARFQKIKNTEDPLDMLPYLKLVQGFFNMIAKLLTRGLLDTVDDMSKKLGLWGLAIGAVLYYLLNIFVTIKLDGSLTQPLLVNLLVFPIVILAQYIAVKFLGAGSRLISHTSTKFGSKSFLDCLALIALLGALGGLFAGIAGAIQAESLATLIMGLGIAFLCMYLMGICLNPETIHIQVEDDASVAEEAVGIYFFFMKIKLRLVPVLYGVINVGGALIYLYFILAVFLTDQSGAFGILFQMQPIMMAMLASTLLPLIFYLGYLLAYLWIEVVRSIMILPEKVQKLRD